jgi:hypothetical protein
VLTEEQLNEMRNQTYFVQCPDCRGDGVKDWSVRRGNIACETCGGHEDSAGTGVLATNDVDLLLDHIEQLEAALSRMLRDVSNW